MIVDISALSDKIISIIRKSAHTVDGHFCLHPALNEKKSICINSWIDFCDILTDTEIMPELISVFTNYMCSGTFISNDSINNINDYFLLGIADDGVALASGIGYVLKLPFSSIIPNDRLDAVLNFKDDDLKAILAHHDKIIILVGVSATGKTILYVCEKIKELKPDSTIIAVLGIINRENGTSLKDDLQALKIACDFIVKDFPIDLCNKVENCPHGKKCEN